MYNELGITFLYEPFYVGKGKNLRYMRHLKLSKKEKKFNTHKSGKIDRIIKDGYNLVSFIILPLVGIEENEAFNAERKFIEVIGRHDLQKGPLTNQSDGGKGSFDKGSTNPSIKNKHLKPRHKMSQNQKNYLSNIRSKQIKQIDKKTGQIIHVWKNAKIASKALNISLGGIHATVNEKLPTKSSGGYFWEYVSEPNKKYINGVKYKNRNGLNCSRTREFIIYNLLTKETKKLFGLTEFCKNNNLHLRRFRYSIKSKLPQNGWIVIK